MTTNSERDDVGQTWIHGQHWTAALVLVGLMGLVSASVLAGAAGLVGLLVLALLVLLASVPDVFNRR